jgi:hypothetical protein
MGLHFIFTYCLKGLGYNLFIVWDPHLSIHVLMLGTELVAKSFDFKNQFGVAISFARRRMGVHYFMIREMSNMTNIPLLS